jgi:aldehyde dehydrogenase (NAD+)
LGIRSRSRIGALHIESRYGLFIGGKWPRRNPGNISTRSRRAMAKSLAEIPLANAADVDAAYQAAATAFKSWSKLPGRTRQVSVPHRPLLQDRAREFAVAETLDGGKPIRESRDFDLPMAAAHFFYHAGWADKLDYVAPGRTLAPLGVSAR